MKKIAFFINPSENWLGGLNYYRNLFKAIEVIENKFIYFIFLPKSAKRFNFEIFTSHKIIYDDNLLLDIKKTLNMYIKRYKINLLSHMNIFSNVFDCEILNWIPDFQHKYLKNFFSIEEIENRNKKFNLYAKYANKVILSSNDALKDFKRFIPEYRDKGCVLNFSPYIDIDSLLRKERKNEKFFFLPNQFWQHKNHITVFKAIKLLKDKSINIKLYCSGSLNDYRSKNHIDFLFKYIHTNDLKDNIKILGMIPYGSLINYMIDSLAVINPSLFEGWSSTVEECKILNKSMILSNLLVHKEQKPKGKYFNPLNENELASILEEVWNIDQLKKKEIDFNGIKRNQLNNLIIYGKRYEEILSSILG